MVSEQRHLALQLSGQRGVVAVEDPAELPLQQAHVVRLETHPPNRERRGEVTRHDLAKNAPRMRPDRMIIGEVRAGEAFDMLQAMNTGHDNSPRDALTRIEQMIRMSGIYIPPRAARAQIASAINVVVQVARLDRRLGRLAVSAGRQVRRGEVIGHVGSTGC